MFETGGTNNREFDDSSVHIYYVFSVLKHCFLASQTSRNGVRFPRLVLLALQYLDNPATSVPRDKIFFLKLAKSSAAVGRVSFEHSSAVLKFKKAF